MGTGIASALAAAAVAVGGLLAGGGTAGSGAAGGGAPGSGVNGSGAPWSAAAGSGAATADSAHTALVIDARLARDGRELVDSRLRELDAELRLPRTTAEAETDLRYLAAQGYRLVVAGPHAQAAAAATGVPASTLVR
jgi:hypothetical protein